MATREAHARWEGSIKEGRGQVCFGKGAFKAPYSFSSRFESGGGTNPEELLGAAHAGCFAMALSLMLGNAGFKPDYIDATAQVTISPQDGGFRIKGSHLVCEAKVPGIDRAAFMQWAEAAKAGCPVSQALAGTEITLAATLK
ncbi:MAG: OsmC family protein [Burkholderiales bacterium]|nr:OsmC family protein [Burkholderiales bacterium]